MPRWLKSAVAVALLATLAAAVDWNELPSQLARLRWWPFVLAIAVTALQMPANAWKWWWSLRLHDLRLSWPFLLRASCTAYFVNNFLPSAIGGDVYRIWRTAYGSEKTRAISAVLVERLVGLGALLVNGTIGALALAHDSIIATSYITFAATAACCALAVWAALMFGGSAAIVRRSASIGWLAPLGANLQRLLRARSEWLWLAGASFLFQFLTALVVWLAFRAVGTELTPAAVLLVTAAAGIASVLPISISGIGVVEGAMAGTATALGVPYEAAVLGAIAVRLIVIPVSAACGLVYLWDDGARARTACVQSRAETSASE
jgi:glycosyltransferase 2 family protein